MAKKIQNQGQGQRRQGQVKELDRSDPKAVAAHIQQKMTEYHEIAERLRMAQQEAEEAGSAIAKDLYDLLPKGARTVQIGDQRYTMSHRGESYFIKTPNMKNTMVIG